MCFCDVDSHVRAKASFYYVFLTFGPHGHIYDFMISCFISYINLRSNFGSSHFGSKLILVLAATCDGSMLICHVAGRGHSDRSFAIMLSLSGGPATEQANKSGGTLATTQSIYDSTEKSQIVVKDEHHCCRALLLASYAIVRSGNNGKQGWQP